MRGFLLLPSDTPDGCAKQENHDLVETWRGFPCSLAAKCLHQEYRRKEEGHYRCGLVGCGLNAIKHGFAYNPSVIPQIHLFRRGTWPASCFRLINSSFFLDLIP
jgi:hypothetical protein